jgi:hypothetical protein
MLNQAGKLDRQARKELRVAEGQEIFAEDAGPEGGAAPIRARIRRLNSGGGAGDVGTVESEDGVVPVEKYDSETSEEGETCCCQEGDDYL